ncbi:MAG: HD domain-containing phosphohydrolase [Candidatus Competibacteraceae bacterium]
MSEIDIDNLLQRLEVLHRIGIALSKEKDIDRFLETVVMAAQQLANADGGTLYRLEGGLLHFKIVRNERLNLSLGGTTGRAISFSPIPLYDDSGQPNDRYVATYAVIHNTTVVIEDAYDAALFDFSGTRDFDYKTGYRSRSFLTVPMPDYQDEIVGVLQLINAKDPATGAVIPFSQTDQELTECLASQAAIALANRSLIDQLKALFESLLNLIDTALDEESPHTCQHCQRVPLLAMLIAEAVNAADTGPFRKFRLSEEEQYELKIASLLHDCGKIATPIHVVDKATKLETVFDRIYLLDTRFEVLKRDSEIRWLQEKIAALERNDRSVLPGLEAQREQRLQQLEDDRGFLHRCNLGRERITPKTRERIERIAAYRWTNEQGDEADFLTTDEVKDLVIASGTLNSKERAIIENHVVLTQRMLNALPWPKYLRHVPEYASSHHEHLDGRGYHRGLRAEQLSVPARILCMADVFEALTAPDRPYKKGKTLSEALSILGGMALERHIDKDLFDLFVREKVWLRYAEQYMHPAQIDAVDMAKIPGYSP